MVIKVGNRLKLTFKKNLCKNLQLARIPTYTLYKYRTNLMYIMYIHGRDEVSSHVLKDFKSVSWSINVSQLFPFSLSLVNSANSYSDGESCL